MIIFEALEIPIFRRALFAVLLASVACGIIGTYVVVKRIASISGGLSHAAFGGVGLGYLLGVDPMLGAAAFCVLSAIGIGIAYKRYHHGLDTLIAMVWSLGMALGILFIAQYPGYAPELSSYLFGSILFVPEEYLKLTFLLDLVILAAVYFFANTFQAISFDEEFAEVTGLPVERVFILLLSLTALTVVVLIRVAGVILTIALLTTPAVIARKWCSSLAAMMALSTLITALTSIGGLFGAYWLSERWNVQAPTGPLIILLVTAVYIVSLILHRLLARG